MSFELNVLTYNMHKGFSGLDRRFVLHAMREALANSNSHLVFLQEVQGEHKRRANRIAAWPELAQYEFIAQELWPNFSYGRNATHAHGHHGNAILSCFPLIGCENISVSPYPFAASRGILHGKVNLPDRSDGLHVLCVHFGFVSYERRRQVRRLFEYIVKRIPSDAPLVIAGDFNDWSGSAIEASEIGVLEAYHELHGEYANTWPSWAPVFPMDRIYYRGLMPIAARQLGASPWSRLSDHIPLQACFQI